MTMPRALPRLSVAKRRSSELDSVLGIMFRERVANSSVFR
jgi:hypothetical protein